MVPRTGAAFPKKIALLVAFALAPLILQEAGPAPAAPSQTSITEDNWSLNYSVTADDGVSISSAYYKSTQLLYQATIPYIPVEYNDGGEGFDELFSGLLSAGPYRVDLTNGFRIEAVYTDVIWPACTSYKYTQRWDFYSDGRFVPTLWIQGPGKMVDHTYHFRLRMDYDIAGSSSDNFDRWEGGTWVQKTVEHTFWDDDANDPEQYEWRLRDGSRGFRIGTYDSPASLAALRYHAGEDDYIANEYPPYPSTNWDNNESIQNSDLVTWNVTQRYWSDGPSTCNTGSMVPGPFGKAYGY